MKEHEKLGQKQVSKVTLHFVWGPVIFQVTNSALNHFTIFEKIVFQCLENKFETF